MSEPRKMLRLTVEVPDFWADELDEYAGYCSDPRSPGPEDRLYVVTEEWMRPDAILVLTSIPGDKCMNEDFAIYAKDVRIVGAEIVDRQGEQSDRSEP